ncbi:hypothetical protein BKA62DRAFT_692032 [Auriculariales sp. MPI-PUGE-AT-0066]|nr:hypothetical protein BKA62DRAFT_692032 [Auriculariales sp. MPI-PUGE-AT-0066]
MRTLHRQKNLRYYVDSAVYRNNVSKQDEFLRTVKSYGKLDFSLFKADIIFVHPSKTDCASYDHVPGLLVHHTYVKHDREKRSNLTSKPRLPFDNYPRNAANIVPSGDAGTVHGKKSNPKKAVEPNEAPAPRTARQRQTHDGRRSTRVRIVEDESPRRSNRVGRRSTTLNDIHSRYGFPQPLVRFTRANLAYPQVFKWILDSLAWITMHNDDLGCTVIIEQASIAVSLFATDNFGPNFFYTFRGRQGQDFKDRISDRIDRARESAYETPDTFLNAQEIRRVIEAAAAHYKSFSNRLPLVQEENTGQRLRQSTSLHLRPLPRITSSPAPSSQEKNKQLLAKFHSLGCPRPPLQIQERHNSKRYRRYTDRGSTWMVTVINFLDAHMSSSPKTHRDSVGAILSEGQLAPSSFEYFRTTTSTRPILHAQVDVESDGGDGDSTPIAGPATRTVASGKRRDLGSSADQRPWKRPKLEVDEFQPQPPKRTFAGQSSSMAGILASDSDSEDDIVEELHHSQRGWRGGPL